MPSNNLIIYQFCCVAQSLCGQFIRIYGAKQYKIVGLIRVYEPKNACNQSLLHSCVYLMRCRSVFSKNGPKQNRKSLWQTIATDRADEEENRKYAA